jgi:hypothetical protein
MNIVCQFELERTTTDSRFFLNFDLNIKIMLYNKGKVMLLMFYTNASMPLGPQK